MVPRNTVLQGQGMCAKNSNGTAMGDTRGAYLVVTSVGYPNENRVRYNTDEGKKKNNRYVRTTSMFDTGTSKLSSGISNKRKHGDARGWRRAKLVRHHIPKVRYFNYTNIFDTIPRHKWRPSYY